MKLRRMDTTGPFALVRAPAGDGRRGLRTSTDRGDRRTGVVLGTYSAGGQATQRVSRRAVPRRAVRRAGAALRQHGRQRGRRTRRPRVQAARTERHDQPEGGVRPRGDCRGRRSPAPRPRRCASRAGGDRRDLRDVLQRPRSLRRDVAMPSASDESQRAVRRVRAAGSSWAKAASSSGSSATPPARADRAARFSAPAPSSAACATQRMARRSGRRWRGRCASRSRMPACRRPTSHVVYASANATPALDDVEASALSRGLRRIAPGR